MNRWILALALLASVAGLCYWAHVARRKASITQDSLPHLEQIDFSRRVPVPLNRGPEVLDGFHGDVHPVFQGPGQLEVTASWNFDRNQSGAPPFFWDAPPVIHDLFMRLEVAIPTRTYTARNFSRLLPAKELGGVGQMWALDLDQLADFLKQFHPAPSMRLVAKGRRPGPDGAFAVLRGVSPSYLDIAIRVHAEFDVMPESMKRRAPDHEAWYSPACFLGRLVINRETGKIEYFILGLPTNHASNVHVTVGYEHGQAHGWMRVNRMELVAGAPESIASIRWMDEIEPAVAFERLAKVFFKFKQIDWVPFDRAQEIARASKKPIFAVVAMGSLDSQTC